MYARQSSGLTSGHAAFAPSASMACGASASPPASFGLPSEGATSVVDASRGASLNAVPQPVDAARLNQPNACQIALPFTETALLASSSDAIGMPEEPQTTLRRGGREDAMEPPFPPWSIPAVHWSATRAGF